MHLGKLGEQIVFKSQKAFSHLNFIGVEEAVASVYFKKKDERDKEARQAYRKTRSSADSIDDIFIIDIMRENIKNL